MFYLQAEEKKGEEIRLIYIGEAREGGKGRNTLETSYENKTIKIGSHDSVI